MQTLQFVGLPRAERPQDSKEFTEPSTGVKLTFTLRAAGAADCALAQESCQRLCEDFIDGSADRPAGPFPDPDIKISRQLFLNAATIAEMVIGPEIAALDFVFLSDRCPTIYAHLMNLARDLNRKWETSQGNSPRVPMEPSAALP